VREAEAATVDQRRTCFSGRLGSVAPAAAYVLGSIEGEAMELPSRYVETLEFFSVKLWWRCVLRARSGLSLTASG
jgi:hypothetical protein